MARQKSSRRMKVAIRLIGGFGCVSLLVLIVSGIGQTGLTALAHREVAGDAADALVEQAYRCRMTADAWHIDGKSEHLDEARQLVATALGQANGLADHFGLNDGKDSKNKQTIRQAIGVVKGRFDGWLAAFQEAVQSEGGGDPGSENLALAGTALQQQTQGLRAALRSARDTVRQRSTILIVVVAAAAVALGLMLAMILTRSILVPLNKCTATLVALRDGRVPDPCDVQSQDEFGQMAAAINDLIATCRQPLGEQLEEPQPV
jgi:methyl-accepting chemotaxis protein